MKGLCAGDLWKRLQIYQSCLSADIVLFEDIIDVLTYEVFFTHTSRVEKEDQNSDDQEHID